MAEARPTVSVIMPVLNPHPDYFPRAVASVLGQTCRDLELIIVEDPSAASGRDLLRSFDDRRVVHIVNPQRTSLIEQLNRGLAEAKADLVARCDADDECEPDRLAKQIAYFERHADIDVLGSQLQLIDSLGRRLGYRAYPLDHSAIVAALRRYNSLPHPSVMLRRDVLVREGAYRLDAPEGAEDYDLWSRWACRGVRFANHPEPLLRYRINPSAVKVKKLRAILHGTLAVKRRYWRSQMTWRDTLRMGMERVFLWLPARVVMSLFLKTQCRNQLPKFSRKSA